MVACRTGTVGPDGVTSGQTRAGPPLRGQSESTVQDIGLARLPRTGKCPVGILEPALHSAQPAHPAAFPRPGGVPGLGSANIREASVRKLSGTANDGLWFVEFTAIRHLLVTRG